jgi:hypothetical protein
MPYRWEPNAGASGRYRDERGRFVASSTVRRELDRYLDTADPAKALAEALRGRQLSVADWEVAMRRHVKNTHLNAIALERGGWANMTPADYGRAGQIIREQYGYLKNFAGDIASGKQRLDGTLGVRAKLYTQAGRETFYRSKQANLAAGVDMVRSVRHARDSCSECVSLDGKWFRVGDPTYKLPGQRICTKNCRCTEEYGRQTADGVEAVEGDRPGATVATSAPAWKPVMTPAEAEAWAKDSALQGQAWHGTSKEAAAEIERNGFAVKHEGTFGRTYGHGVYMVYGEAPDEAELYGGGGVLLETRVNVRRVLEVNRQTWGDYFEVNLRAEMADKFDPEAINKALARDGYDALLIRLKSGTTLMVPDPKRVVVVRR